MEVEEHATVFVWWRRKHLLEGLEAENIDILINVGDPELCRAIGERIAKEYNGG